MLNQSKYFFSNHTRNKNELNLDDNIQIPILSQNYKEICSNLETEDYYKSESTYFKDVLKDIDKTASQLNNALDNIKITETNQQQFISVGKELNNLTLKLKNINKDESNLESIEIGKYFQLLQQNSPIVIDETTEFTLVLGAAIYELENTINKLKTLVYDVGLSFKLAENTQSFNIALSSINVSPNEASNTATTVSSNFNELQVKLEEFKNILYQKLKKEFNFNFEKIKRSNNINYELKEYALECIRLKRSKTMLKVLLRDKFQIIDLDLRHYFRMFLVQYEKSLFKVVLNESSEYIPKSRKFIECCDKDKQYNLLKDLEQFELLHQFLVEIISLDNLNAFNDLIKNKTEILVLFFDTLENSNFISF
jgi:hypothetical protein